MPKRLDWPNLTLATALALLFACGPTESSQQVEPHSAPSPSQDPEGELPAGHPPVVSPAPSARVVPPAPNSGTGATGLSWQVPDGWVEERPTSTMRRAQYRVPGEDGDGECVVFYFGPGEGGSAMANAQRWADQFAQPDGGTSREALATRELDVGGIVVLLSEVTGTYSGGMTMMGQPPSSLEGHMLLGAVAEGPDANWFFKLTGPERTIRSQQAAFEAMIRSLRTGT